MENTLAKRPISVKDLAHSETFKKQISDTLGARTPQFISSVLSLVNSDKALAKCNPYDVFNCCLVAASLNLPVNKDLGQAWVIPYRDKTYGDKPQLQIGWKGFVQLAQRTGQFKTINTTDVRKGELQGVDRLTGEMQFQWVQNEDERKELEVVGYLAYFRLTNGFEKSLYMSLADLEAHAKRYSKSYSTGKSVWKSDFSAMASKTVLKLLLNRYAPLDTAMQKAIASDQATDDGEYVDNPKTITVKDAELGSSEEAEDANEITG